MLLVRLYYMYDLMNLAFGVAELGASECPILILKDQEGNIGSILGNLAIG
jgi:hypothetical protein